MNNHAMNSPDFLIIGAGIIGLSIARELQSRHPNANVTIMDKEDGPGCHASGRNSGVMHSGIYYTADSLKARFTRDGNLAWQEYCAERSLCIDKCGKLIVPRDAQELQALSILEERGAKNSVKVYRIDRQQARDIESRAKVFEQALFVPSTATVDPLEILRSLEQEFKENGGSIHYNCSFMGRESKSAAQTSQGLISAGYIVNCAGLYADRVAQAFEFGHDYVLLPFKGLYLYAGSKTNAPKVHIYPVPDLRNPFLGVHFTRTIDDKTKIGPTAIPALWRENYQGLNNFRLDELAQILGCEMKMFCFGGNGFRRLAWQEIKKQRKSTMVAEAASLMHEAQDMNFDQWGRAGIRAQLLDKRTGKLEMDFVLQGDDRSMHVLNAVSPALTCALPFASYVVDRMEDQRSH